MVKMRPSSETIIALTLVSCCCGLAVARCLRKGEAAGFIQECLEIAAPGITNNLDKTNLVLKVMGNYKYNETSDKSDTINQAAVQAVQCVANKMEQTFPEITDIWKDCDKKANSQRDKRAECMEEEEHKICPKVRPKRSTFSHIDLFMSAAELQGIV